MNYYFIVGAIFLLNAIINIIFRFTLKYYSSIKLRSNNLTGEEIVRRMLRENGIHDVDILLVNGELNDHYNPINKTVNLSEKVFYGKDAVALAISAHECAHALQHKIKNSLLKIRDRLVPILNISSKITNISIMYGLAIFYSSGGKNSVILKIGIGLFLIIVIFSLLTLPIEFNASNKALHWVRSRNLVNYKEYLRIRKILRWASMTYVIYALGDIAQLTYFMSLINKNNNKEW